MFSSLALAALLTMSPAQLGGTLTLTNARSNYGELGTIRPDNKLLPGDIFFLGFDIEAIKVDEEGSVSYTMSMEVVDKAGKSIFKQKPENKKDFLPLGGNKLPARAFVSIGLDQAPGIYTCKVIVEDRAAKTTATMEKNFEVVAPGFGLVQVYTSCDDRGALPAPQVGIVGQSVWVQFALVGFERGKDPSQPEIGRASCRERVCVPV